VAGGKPQSDALEAFGRLGMLGIFWASGECLGGFGVSSAQADFWSQGTMVSENLLSNANVTDITGFSVTASVPAGTTVSVSFSQDRVNFFSSDGTAFGWDSCANGVTAIDISGLNWSEGSLFYKLKLETTDPLVTPSVSEVELTYEGDPVPPAGNLRYVEGFLLSTDLLASAGRQLTGQEFFGYGISSLPYGTDVYVQFSVDGTNFFSSNGTAWGWDELSFGDHLTPETALDLSALNWKGESAFYYKLKLTTEVDEKTTPVVKTAGLLSMSASFEDGGGTGEPLPDPVAHWKFDEGYASTAHDESGNGNDGTITGASWSLNGKFGKALSFDGTDDRVGFSGFQFLASDKFSISKWVKFGALATEKPLVSQWGGSQNNVLVKTDDTNSDELKICVASSLTDDCANYGYTTDANLSTDAWKHFGVVYDGTQGSNEGKLKLFIDGAQKTLSFSGTIPATIQASSTDELEIGGDADLATYANALIDEVKIFNSALSADQVKQDFNGGKAIQLGSSGTNSSTGLPTNAASGEYCVPGSTDHCAPPVGEWKFDEKEGTTAFDTSGNGNNGTLTNGPVWDRGKFGGALSFNGSNSYVDIGVGPSSVKTLSFWAYPETSTEYFMNLTSNTDYVWSNSGTVTASGISATIYVDGRVSNSLVANKWQHITITSSTAENASNLDFGRTQDANYMQGKIDQVRFYDYVRTPAQIAWEYNKGKPVAHWAFNECQGSTIHDESGNGNHGTLNLGSSGVTTVGTCASSANSFWYNGRNGKYNSGGSFDGADDVAHIAGSEVAGHALDLTDNFSITAWIKQDTNGQGTIVGKRDGNTWQYQLYTGPNKILVLEGSSSYYSNPNAYTDNVWQNVAVVVRNGQLRYYNNGKDVGGGSYSTTYKNIPVSIGARWNVYPATGFQFEGLMDDVKIFNYPLTVEQVKQEHNSGAVKFGE
jgi:hypothetical protein